MALFPYHLGLKKQSPNGKDACFTYVSHAAPCTVSNSRPSCCFTQFILSLRVRQSLKYPDDTRIDTNEYSAHHHELARESNEINVRRMRAKPEVMSDQYSTAQAQRRRVVMN